MQPQPLGLIGEVEREVAELQKDLERAQQQRDAAYQEADDQRASAERWRAEYAALHRKWMSLPQNDDGSAYDECERREGPRRSPAELDPQRTL